MGEQPTSSSDLAWSGQAEIDGTRGMDSRPGRIEARSASISPPLSSPIDMPPKTRSQSRSANAPLPTLEEGIAHVSIQDDDYEPPSPVAPPSPGYDPAQERRERQPEGTGTPAQQTHYRAKAAPSVSSENRDKARKADPNHGSCILTNVKSAIQLCHILAKATDYDMLTQLEYVWGIGYRQLNVNMESNLMHLRADWHVLFDSDQWLLVPEEEVLQNLSRIYLGDNSCVTSDITKIFVHPTYRYYVLPVPTLEAPICRFPDTGSRDHNTYFPPFLDLGLLEGHFHPHFVIVNAGRKLAKFGPNLLDMDMAISFSQMVTPSGNAVLMLAIVQRLYAKWTEVKVPDQFLGTDKPSKRLHPPGEGGRDARSQDGPAKHEGPRSGTRSQASRSSAGQNAGGQQRAVLPIPASEDDASSITDDTIVEDDTEWIEYIHNWQKQGDGVAEDWEPNVLNDAQDEQLAAYVDEHARTPPSAAAWGGWKSAWEGRKSRFPSASDRSMFSSNDWAVFKSDVYLTRHMERPPITV